MSDSAHSPSAIRPPWALMLFCLWLVLLPLPLGANRAWAGALVWPPLFLLAAVVCLGPRGRLLPLPRWLVGWPGAGLLVFLALLAAQLFPGSPAASMVPFRTLPYALTALACVTAGWLAVTLVRDEISLRWLIGAVVAAGLMQSAIAVGLLGWGQPVTIVDTDLGGQGLAVGTFPNRNHLAFFLNLALACGIGLLVGSLQPPQPGRTWKQVLRDWLELMLSPKARLRLLLILMVIALILTRSRGGNAAFFVGLVFAMVVYAIHAGERRRGMLLLAASLVVVDLVLIGTWVGVDKVVDRVQRTAMQSQGAVDEEAALREALGTAKDAPSKDATEAANAKGDAASGSAADKADDAAPADEPKAPAPAVAMEQSLEDRIQPATEAIAMVRQYPWVGTGGGSFYLAFMPWMQRDMGFYDHAHNDYLEIAADMGVVGLGALMLFGLASAWRAFTLVRDRRNPAVRGACFAALMALACIATHSLVDFSLQIQAIAVMSTVVLLLPFAAAQVPRKGHRREARKGDAAALADAKPATQVARWVAAFATAGVMLIGTWHSWRIGVADYLSVEANRTIATWEALGLPPTADGINDVLRALQAPIDLVPDNAEYREGRASLFYARAVTVGRTTAQRIADYAAALEGYREAAARSPYSGYVWGNLMLVKFRIGEIDPEFFYAFDRAATLAPYEPSVQRMVTGVGFALWQHIPPGAQSQVIDTVRRAWLTNREGMIEEAAGAKDLALICKVDALPLQALCKAVKDATDKQKRDAAK